MTPAEKQALAEQLLGEAREALEAEWAAAVGARRGALWQRLWSLRRMLGEIPQYFSQAGQDWFVDRHLSGGRRDGVFVDVGGYDGVSGSNTLFFEAFRGWSGLLVEPAPGPLGHARALRRCRCVGDAVAGREASGRFIEVLDGYTQMSGLVDSYDPGLLAQVRAHPAHAERVEQVACRPLADVLREAGLGRIDYLSLDVEGAEREILGAFPFDAFDIGCWSIENNTGDPWIEQAMSAAGYRRVEFLGVDEIYARRELGR